MATSTTLHMPGRHRRPNAQSWPKVSYGDRRSHATCTCGGRVVVCPRCTPVNYAREAATHKAVTR